MRYSAQQKQEVLEHYFSNGCSPTKTMAAFGFASRKSIYRWSRQLALDAGAPRGHGHGVHCPLEAKAETARLAVEGRSTMAEVASHLGVASVRSVYRWAAAYRKGGVAALVPKKRYPGPAPGAGREASPPPDGVDALRRENYEVRLENAVLNKTIEVLKKDPGLGGASLTNREKAAVIGSLRPQLPLKDLLRALGMAKSSYEYQAGALRRPDKHARLREKVRELFFGRRSSRGYRPLWAMLRQLDEPLAVSGKVVRRIMREEGLVPVYNRRRRRHSSYEGEIGQAPDNLLGRDFSAAAPPTRSGSPTSPSSSCPQARTACRPSSTASTARSSPGLRARRPTPSWSTPC
jgi:transposase-like protein